MRIHEILTEPVETVAPSIASLRPGRMAGIVTVSDLLDLLGKGGERRVANACASLHYRVPEAASRPFLVTAGG